MALGNSYEYISHINMRFNLVQLTGCYNWREYCPVLHPRITARKERFFTVQRDWTHATLDGVIFDLDTAISQEQI